MDEGDPAVDAGIRKFNQRRYGAAIADFSSALRRAPRHAGLHYFRSMAYKMAGDATAALRDAEAAIRANPGSMAVRALKSELEMSRGTNGRLPESWRDAGGHEPTGVQGRLGTAILLRDAGRFAAALEECRAALRIDPRSAESLELKSELERKRGFKSSALRSLRRAIALEPGRPAWRLKAAGLMRELGRSRAALKECEAAIRLDPGNAAALELKSDIESDLGLDLRSWDTLRKAIRREPRRLRLRLRAVRILKGLGHISAALAQCEAAIRLVRRSRAPEPKSSRESQSSALTPSLRDAMADGSFQNPRSLVETLRSLAPERRWTGRRRWSGGSSRTAVPGLGAEHHYFFRGVLLKPGRGDRYEDALPAHVRRVLSARYGWKWLEFGIYELHKGRRGDREGADDVAMAAEGSVWKIHAMLGEAYALLGEPRKALGQLRRARAAAPPSHRGEVLAWAGKAHLWLGDFQEALRSLDRAVSMGLPDALRLRGIAKLKLGDMRGAFADLDRVVEMTPWDVEAWNWRAEARRLLGDYLRWSAHGWRPCRRDFLE